MLNKTINGFSLSEVLITLGIIGTVAAMTLPALVNQTRGKELETGLKKAYSVLQQTIARMNYEEGQIANTTSYNETYTFMKVFKNYLQISQDCDKSSCELSEKLDDAHQTLASKRYKTYNNHNLATTFLDDGQAVVTDGMFIMVENNKADGRNLLFISVDVNGYNKKPNRWGHDLFTFQIMDDGKLMPMGANGTSHYTQNDTYCSATSTDRYNGIACTYKALTDKDYFANLPK